MSGLVEQGLPAPAWSDRKSPSGADIEALAMAAYQSLPDAFRKLAGAILFAVQEFPEPEVLDALAIDCEFDLLGLYHGVSLDRRSEAALPMAPDTIILYRRPLLDYWCEHDETLGALVRHVMIHEIGHHFGLSDDDMERIEMLDETAAIGPQE